MGSTERPHKSFGGEKSGVCRKDPARTTQVKPGMELAKNLRIDSVSRLNATAPRQVSPSCSVAQAVALMRQEKVGCLLVCVAEQIVGIFTERDLMRRVLAANQPLSAPISDFMTANPVVVHP